MSDSDLKLKATKPATSTAPPQSGGEGRSRVHSLDGLRGLAALVVLFHHSLLASSAKLAGAYQARGLESLPIPKGLAPASGTLDWLITYTPLHVFWAGPEFVVVFFVLSGFVLSLPVARGRSLNAFAYYPSRMARLYLPVWGALALAAALHLLVSRHTLAGAGWWLNIHVHGLTLKALERDATLGSGAGDYGFTSVLWSLHWEVIFSLLLPILLLLPLKARSVAGALLVLCAVALSYGESKLTLELPPFLLGMLLAFQAHRIERLEHLLGRRSLGAAALGLALFAASLCLLSADWWLSPARATQGLVAAGACLLLVLALSARPLKWLLSSRPMQWTGKRAFSLYLVHEPLVVALAFALDGRAGGVTPVEFLLVATPLALLLAGLFFRVVEAPSHRFARTLGSRGGRPAVYMLEACPVRASS